jgi:hypothetical protein
MMRHIKIFEDQEMFPPTNGFSCADYIFESHIKFLFDKQRRILYGYYFESYEDIKEPLYLVADKNNRVTKNL